MAANVSVWYFKAISTLTFGGLGLLLGEGGFSDEVNTKSGLDSHDQIGIYAGLTTRPKKGLICIFLFFSFPFFFFFLES